MYVYIQNINVEPELVASHHCNPYSFDFGQARYCLDCLTPPHDASELKRNIALALCYKYSIENMFWL